METIERQFAPIANSTAMWRSEMERMAQSKVPSFFHIRGRLPVQGRTNAVLGASRQMNVVLKTYASGGENEIHAHSNEDHLFIVMQGGATFYGPRGETRTVGKNDCVLIPAHAYYWFLAKEGQALVMLRVGAALDPDQDILARVDLDGKPFDGNSEKNKEVPCILSDEEYFE